MVELTQREVAVIIALTEDLKARWQHRLNLDNEINTWTSSYVIALVVGVSYILNSEKFLGLQDFFSARNYDNSFFILSLAGINAIYILALAFKGYQVQQICFYIHTELEREIYNLTGVPSTPWEIWLRTRFNSKNKIGKPEWRRSFYYTIIMLLPFSVSFAILFTYFKYIAINLSWLDPHNIYFYVNIVIHLIVAILSLSTISFNKKWNSLVIKSLEQGMFSKIKN